MGEAGVKGVTKISHRTLNLVIPALVAGTPVSADM